jgi:uncharacterized protein YkwD
MTLLKPLRAFRAPITLTCAALLAISPAAAAAAVDSGSVRARAAADTECRDSTLAPNANDLPQIAASVLCLVNSERASADLPALELNGELARASQPMADLMVNEQFFSHDTPDGRDLFDRIKTTGYVPRSNDWVLGENLAWGSGELATPQAIVNGWMNSPGHRANILARDYRDIGIGLALGSPVATHTGGATYVTDFGLRVAATPAKLTVSVPRQLSAKAKHALARGVALRASCSRACTLVGRLFLEAKTARAAHLRGSLSGSLHLARAGHGTVTVRLNAKAKRILRRSKHLTMTLVTTASGTGVARTTRVTLT